ncbi:MAG: type II toxin-antitoxin system ParD family antitoxin [Oceanicaulis sp.]|uniref:type II toxin-antitoxin system ParD family antitoxin n=1 Tax=Glycocaulis sp. TaxID=1969725 RepID=UPI0025BF6732|nr:type II toxin-antitoxin system ParD family antitoxin [Glycocaulis sp.]MCC5980145.1 type II toxin-antitoxin system ParD family antitoxin [Oceanicaulis sp.]MCH8522495.1 type II toxin-antitoxin system ParD family antitoxin [Glycocaulis sp.]
MVTRNVVLTDTQTAMLDGLVKSGRYQNVSEAMRAGLRLLEREEAALAALRARLEEGLSQADAGEFMDGSAEDIITRVFADAERRHSSPRGE